MPVRSALHEYRARVGTLAQSDYAAVPAQLQSEWLGGEGGRVEV